MKPPSGQPCTAKTARRLVRFTDACSIETVKRWQILAAVVAALLIAAGAAFLLRENIANYWIKRQLAGKLTRALGAEVDLQGVAWKDGVLTARRFQMSGGDYPFQSLEAHTLRAIVDWRDLLDPSSQPLRVEIAEVDVVWVPNAEPNEKPTAPSARSPASRPLDLRVEKCSLRRDDGQGWSVDGTRVHAMEDAGIWSLSAEGGSLIAEGRPPLQIERLAAENKDGVWSIGGFALKNANRGTIAGSAVNSGGIWSAEISWQDLDLTMLVPPDFSGHLGGRATGDAVLKDGVLSGKTKIEGAETQTVGIFVRLASLLDHEEWNRIPWHIFRFNFVWQADGRMEMTDLQAVSSKGLTVLGKGHFAPDRIDADLRVGVRAAGRPILAAFVPVLFDRRKDGYYWTRVRVGGTPAAPTENLSERVAAALTLAPAAGAAESVIGIPGSASEVIGGLLREMLPR